MSDLLRPPKCLECHDQPRAHRRKHNAICVKCWRRRRLCCAPGCRRQVTLRTDGRLSQCCDHHFETVVCQLCGVCGKEFVGASYKARCSLECTKRASLITFARLRGIDVDKLEAELAGLGQPGEADFDDTDLQPAPEQEAACETGV